VGGAGSESTRTGFLRGKTSPAVRRTGEKGGKTSKLEAKAGGRVERPESNVYPRRSWELPGLREAGYSGKEEERQEL